MRSATTGAQSRQVHTPVVATRLTHRPVVLALAGAGLAAALLYLAVYPRIGFDADSVTYVGVARNIAASHGITYPFRTPGARMADFPPGYPLVLAAGHFVGLPVVGFAHVLQALLLAASGVLAGLLVFEASESAAFAVMAFLLVMVAAGLDEVFAIVYSEPLAIALQLGALLALAVWARKPRPWILVVAGVCAACSPLVRWVGVSVIVAGALIVFVYGAGKGSQRFRLAAVWGGVSLLPGIAAALTNRGSGSGSGTARELAWHAITWTRVREGLDTVASWLLPHQLSDRWVFGLVMVIAAVVALGVPVARHGRAVVERAGPAVVAPIVFLVVYVGTLVLSISFFDASTPLDARILAPAYAVVVPIIVGLLAQWWRATARTEHARRLALIATIAVCALVGVRGLTTATGNQDSRLGYAAAHWRRAALMQHLDALPRASFIVTNAPEAVYLQTGREARGLPSKFSSTSLRPQAGYHERLEALITTAAEEHGVFAMFDEVKGRPWLPKADELEHDEHLRVVDRLSDGVVLAPAS